MGVKRYICPYCSARLTHGECYKHQLFDCQQRPGFTVAQKQKPERTLKPKSS